MCVAAAKEKLRETEQDLKSRLRQESPVSAKVGKDPRGAESCQPNHPDSS